LLVLCSQAVADQATTRPRPGRCDLVLHRPDLVLEWREPAVHGGFHRGAPPAAPAASLPRARRQRAQRLHTTRPALLGVNATSWVAETENPGSGTSRCGRAADEARVRRRGRERLLPDNGAAAEGLSIVEELGTAQSARAELAAQLPRQGARPGQHVRRGGIPGAVGFSGSAPQSSGENVAFAKGRYYYHRRAAGWATGTPSPPTRAQLMAAARSLYQRVRP